MSMVKMVELELKMEVSEDMRAASMTASISPRRPTGIFSLTSLTKARLVQPALELQIRSQSSGVAHPTSSGKSTLPRDENSSCHLKCILDFNPKLQNTQGDPSGCESQH